MGIIHSSNPLSTHTWLHQINIAFVPGPMSPLLEAFMAKLLSHFTQLGHTVQTQPGEGLDALFTTAAFGEPVNWRKSLMFTARKRLNLARQPAVVTVLHAHPRQFHQLRSHFERALAKEDAYLTDFDFPGLAPQAFRTLFEQGRRGGPILSVMRLLQAQAKCIRLLLVIGDDAPQEAYLFDLVGAHPRIDAAQGSAFYAEIALRLVTALSSEDVTNHQVVMNPIPRLVWEGLRSPAGMLQAGAALGRRGFFTQMVRVSDLALVPSVPEVVANQYSEGCFATWEPALDALIATVTGSARPVEKDKLTDDELAVIVGLRQDNKGATIRHVEGKRNDPPSSEAVELFAMDRWLPRIRLAPDWDIQVEVPVVRSKLHGHRGVRAYDPERVEHVYLDPPYYHYPVSCATDAQSRAIQAAFSRSQALGNPSDPRQIVFTILPGHGVLIVEKWVPGKAPFQVIWDAMDSGAIQIDSLVPQGLVNFIQGEDHRMALQADFD